MPRHPTRTGRRTETGAHHSKTRQPAGRHPTPQLAHRQVCMATKASKQAKYCTVHSHNSKFIGIFAEA